MSKIITLENGKKFSDLKRKKSIKEIAEMFNCQTITVYKAINLFESPEPVKQAIKAKKINNTEALLITEKAKQGENASKLLKDLFVKNEKRNKILKNRKKNKITLKGTIEEFIKISNNKNSKEVKFCQALLEGKTGQDLLDMVK